MILTTDFERLNEKEQVDILLAHLKSIKKEVVRVQKLSDKAYNTNHTNSTPRKVQSCATNLNWACMDLDKLRTDFSRLFKVSRLNVGTEPKNYNPSGFHSYRK